MNSPEKKSPFCKITLDGTCAAVNRHSWIQFYRDQEQKEADSGNYEVAQELSEAAEKTAAGTTYCDTCPLKVKG
jgi:hypothetical protein